MPMLDLTGRKSAEELEKLPRPSNENLKLLFQNVAKVVIKDGGVYNNRAIGNKVLLTILDEDKIARFCQLLGLDESNIGFYCMCSGTYAIEIHSTREIQAVIGLHHGYSIRYEGWSSDVGLSKSGELLQFFFELGFKNPLQDRTKEEERFEEQKREDEKWLSNAPKCFGKYWDEMNNFDDEFMTSLTKDFTVEISERNLQIISLLKIYSVSQSLWTAYPIYENVPETLLANYTLQEIVSTYNSSDKHHQIKVGLGRFLCGLNFRKQRKNYLEAIPQNVIDEIKQTFVEINEKEGVSRIEALQKEKDKKSGDFK